MKALIGYSAAAFLAGVLLNVMPCVLPVIPFKIQAVMREIGGAKRSRIFAAASLLLGSLSFFWVIGGATAYMGLTWGALFQSTLFLAILTLFLFIAALATFLDWSVPLPQSVYKIPIHRYTGAFLTGALAGVLSTPCSGPFLGSVLGYTLTQPAGIVMIIFSAIAAGLAAPYMLIMLWPGLSKRVRFKGVWSVQVKQLFGFVLLAGAIFFGRIFLPPAVHLIIWQGLLALIIIWALFALFRSRQWAARVVPLTIIAGSLLVLAIAKPDDRLKWRKFSAESLQATIAAGQPVLLEFTAKWCLNCEVLEKTTYSDQRVVSAARERNLVAYRVDMTKFNAGHRQLLKKYKGTALPYALLIAPDGRVVRRLSGMFSAKTLVDAMRQLAAP